MFAAFDQPVFGSFAEEQRKERWLFFDSFMKRVPDADCPTVRQIVASLFPLFQAYDNQDNSYWTASGNAHEWQREQRACHPDYFDRFFVLSLPHDAVPDASVKEFITTVNRRRGVELDEHVRSTIEGMKADGKLRDFVERLIVFGDQVDKGGRMDFARSLVRASDIIPQGSMSLAQSVSDRVRALIYVLLEGMGDAIALTDAIETLCQETPGAYMVATLISWAEPKHNGILTRAETIDFDRLRTVGRKRLRQVILDEGQDIFEIEGRGWQHLLFLWSSFFDDKAVVTDFVIGLMERDPPTAARILAGWIQREPWDESQHFRLKDFEQVFDGWKVEAAVRRMRAGGAFTIPADDAVVGLFLVARDLATQMEESLDRVEYPGDDQPM
jgi:hypothetical protein